MAIDIQILDTPLEHATCKKFVEQASAGAVVSFIGNVRNQTKGRKVLYLNFEAYIPMAISEMQKIAQQILADYPAARISMHHRIGQLEIGECAVIISVSTPHRADAFRACQYAIDVLKETVPIWKKEYFEDGEVWVAAHP